MGTARRVPGTMTGHTTDRGGASLTRLLTVIVAALALSLAFTAGSASAKQVYNYVYSGEYIDGSGSEHGTFTEAIGYLAYDKAHDQLLVSEGGHVTRFTKNGTPVPFAATGTDSLPIGGPIAVDNTGGPHEGDIYSAANGYAANGSILPGWPLPNIYNSCGTTVDPKGNIWEDQLSGFDSHVEMEQFTPAGVKTGAKVQLSRSNLRLVFDTSGCNAQFDTAGNFYMAVKPAAEQFGPWTPTKFKVGNEPLEELIQGGAEIGPGAEEIYQLNHEGTNSQPTFAVDESNNDVFVLQNIGRTVKQYDSRGGLLGSFGSADPGHSFNGLGVGTVGIAVDPTTHDVWIADRANSGGGVRHVEKFVRSAPITVPTTDTETPDLTTTTATLRGTINAAGVTTTNCHFEWDPTQTLGSTANCEQGNVFEGSNDHAVTAEISGLNKGTPYYYRLKAENGNGHVSDGGPVKFYPQEPPLVSNETVSHVSTDGAQFNPTIDPNAGYARYHLE